MSRSEFDKFIDLLEKHFDTESFNRLLKVIYDNVKSSFSEWV